LFFRENRYPDSRDSNPYLAMLAAGGYMVEALAKARYKDAVQLSYGRDVVADFEQTRKALEAENVVIFEGTLLVGRRQARCDIIEKKGNRVRLIEVKSKSFNGAAHAESLAAGKFGELRGTRRPYGVLAKWVDYIEDVAFQALLLESTLPGVTVEPWLALVDSSKVSGLDNVPGFFELVESEDGRLQTARFRGKDDDLPHLDLVSEICVKEEVALVREEVAYEALRLEKLLDAPIEEFASVRRGAHCGACEFRGDALSPNGFAICWGSLAEPTPHMLELFSIGTVKDDSKEAVADGLFRAGKASLFDIPVAALKKVDGTIGPVAARQRRQIEWTSKGEAFIDPALGGAIGALEKPLSFIDFETSRLALPYHRTMRPYGLVAFQWSAHLFGSDGSFIHREWLNDVVAWPNASFARSLREAIGDHGSVLTWSPFERSVLNEVVEDLHLFGGGDADLVAWIRNLAERRIVDMHEWARSFYYHPGMKGRTSIKVVLDALWRSDPELRARCSALTGLPDDADADPYLSLPKIEIAGVWQDVHEGTGAMMAYQEMMYGIDSHSPESRSKWGQLLRQYCKLDTLSMVLILEHWSRICGAA
jgi:hypothetical protein